MIPQVAELYKKYKDQGFHVVGLECQGSPEETIQGQVKEYGADFQITVGGKLKGANVSGIPHGFLFGADGKLIEDDPSHRKLEELLKTALKDALGAIAGPGPYVKLAALAAQVKTGQGIGQVLKTAAQKKDSKDAAEAAEAAMMFESLTKAGQDRLDRALALKETEPAAAVDQLDKLALMFSGSEFGDKARTESANLKKDPKVKKELDAATVWKQVETAIGNLKPVRGANDPKSDAFRKANQAGIMQIIGGCQSIMQRYAGTAAAKKAEETLSQYK